MKLYIQSRIPTWNFEKEIDYDIGDYDRIADISPDDLADLIEYLQDELWDFYSDIISGCEVVPRGVFDEREMNSWVCGHARERIESERDNLLLEISDGNSSISVCIADCLLEMLDSDSSCGEFDARVGGYVEQCLLDFVNNASWHIENGRLWFGLDKCLQEWCIDSNTTQDNLEFWSDCQSWTIMKHIGNFDDCFLIWYTAECGYWTPDMNEIREQCPVSFDETDTVETILQKAAAWLERDH